MAELSSSQFHVDAALKALEAAEQNGNWPAAAAQASIASTHAALAVVAELREGRTAP